MKANLLQLSLGLLATSTLYSQVLIDGQADLFDAYNEIAVQTVSTEWGDGNFLANFQAKQEGGTLNLFMGSSAVDNAIILFIDSKPGGVNTITNNLITSGGEEDTINNLGTSPTEGMTFEVGFEADYAIRIYGSADQTQAFVNLYDLQTGQRTFIGEVATTPQSGGIITSIASLYSDFLGNAPDDYGMVDFGVEVGLSLGAMGVAAGEQDIAFTAVLVNNNSTFGSNQILGARTDVTEVMGAGLNAIDFSVEPGSQTMTVTVQNDDNDGDGDPDATDPDDDNDDLLDTSEDGGGVFVSATETGTDPLIADTDGDGYDDGDEVNGTSTLGYASNPNIPNFTVMTVPGSFNLPAPFEAAPGANTPSTDMIQRGTDNLTDQYIWELDYRFTTAQDISFKFAAGSFDTNWGANTATTVTPNGPDIQAEIVASGIHRFTFDQAALTYTLERVTYASLSEFLDAYGLTGNPDGDADFDNLTNSEEFTAGTDPGNADTDGDGTDDDVDPAPLQAGSRDITFSVNTRALQKLGLFDPSSDVMRVVGNFWNDFTIADGPELTDADMDGIYEVTVSISGRPGDFFGEYKFNTDSSTLPIEWNGYEQGGNRNFELGATDTAQILPTVYFETNNFGGNGIYYQWADDFGLDLTNPNSDPSGNADGDGNSNRVEFYFGGDPSVADTLPVTVVNDEGLDLIVTWLQRGDAGITYELQEAADLNSWLPSDALEAEAFDQSGVPFGYSRREAFIFIEDGPNFIQIEATGDIPDPEIDVAQ